MWLKISTVLVLIIVTVMQSQAQIGLGSCPKIKIVENFDSEKYKGRWYELFRTPRLVEEFHRCIYFDVSPVSNDGIVTVKRRMINFFDKEVVNTAKGKVVTPGHAVSWQGDVYVLATDYENFAVVFECKGFLTYQYVVWILARKHYADNSLIDKARGIIEANGLSTKYLIRSPQEDCPKSN